MTTYKVIRFFRDHDQRRVIKTGLTLKEAQEHCNDRETSSSTCTSLAGLALTEAYGPWFDGYGKEN